MSNPSPLNEREQADLVAFLDGELTGEAARAMEAKLSLHPAYRAEAESLKRTWDLLDFLTPPDPTPTFTTRTMSKLTPVRPSEPPPAPVQAHGRVAVFVSAWAAALVIALLAGYQLGKRLAPHDPGEAELVRDLRLIENKRFYDRIDDIDFLRRLDRPDLFGEDSTAP